MSLAVSFHYPERILAAIDVVGISNFVTFLTNTESYRRDLRRVEFILRDSPSFFTFIDTIQHVR